MIAKRPSLLFPQFLEALADVANVDIEKGADEGEVHRARWKLFRPEKESRRTLSEFEEFLEDAPQ